MYSRPIRAMKWLLYSRINFISSASFSGFYCAFIKGIKADRHALYAEEWVSWPHLSCLRQPLCSLLFSVITFVLSSRSPFTHFLFSALGSLKWELSEWILMHWTGRNRPERDMSGLDELSCGKPMCFIRNIVNTSSNLRNGCNWRLAR